MKNTALKRTLHLLLPSLLVVPSVTNATVAQAPLFVNTTIQPNIFFLVDDSGSMDWEILKSDGARATYTNNNTFPNSGQLDITPTREDRDEILESCAGYNVLYYDPNETYVPWIGVDINGNAYGNQSITAARVNPFDPSEGTTNLTDDEGFNDPPGYMVWNDTDGDGEFDLDECPDPGRAGYDYANQFVSTVSGFDPVQVMSATQLQNFANWYTYYRKREYVMKSALLSIIDTSTARLGISTIHRHNDDGFTGFPVADITAGTNRADLSEEVARIFSDDVTPLRQQFEQVGEYFEGTNSTALFGSSQPSPILGANDGGACQQNFAVVMSDGFWNGGAPSVGNADSGDTSDGDQNDTAFDGGVYADQDAGESNTLADVAMHYYERDLNTNLPNEVPTTALDPNNQQHLVTYTVAFGVNGALTANPLPTDISFNWPSPVSNTASTIDDMRHAAFNGRGEFLSAGSPAELIQAFTNAIASIAGRTSSASAVATNSARLRSGSKIYQGRFLTESWSGELLAYEIDADTGDIGNLIWDASERIPLESARSIFTYNDDNNAGSKGVVFERANLSSAHQALLTVAEVDYLRGDRTGEGSLVRSRASLLGDIIGSDPLFASGQDNYGYYLLELTSGMTYYEYLTGTTEDWQKGNRTDMIYVGANDGMLHALLGEGNTSSGCTVGAGNCEGEEIFAYVPKGVYSNLPELPKLNYNHQYYVDGAPQQGDAYIDWGDADSPRWGTALVGTLAGGGAGIFALDISDPLNFTAQNILWDLDDGDLSDLGYTFSKPSITKLANGKWGVVVGNGYHSVNHEPVLYILDLEDGSEIATIKAGADFRGTASSTNGLSTPVTIDTDGDGVTDVIYAGDLRGNMWKYDVSNSNANQWDVAFKDGNGANAKNVPIFTACTADPCTSSNYQPITVKPEVIRANSGGLLVFFGTGKYFEVGDNLDTSQTQTFYAINDDGAVVSGRNVLQEQEITNEPNTADNDDENDYRITSSHSVNYINQKGWFMDMYFDGNPGTTTDGVHNHPGERIVADPQMLGSDLIFFQTLIPETDVCSFGGSTFNMTLNAQTGAANNFSPFDANGDGVIDANDKVAIDTDGDGQADTNVYASGRRSGIGIVDGRTVVSDGSNNLGYDSGSSGELRKNLLRGDADRGRQSWIQIK